MVTAKNRARFNKLTLEILKHKYRYYVLDIIVISDYEYDLIERERIALGRGLGIDMDAYEHWVGFDYKHPMAKKVLKEFNNA